MAKKLRSEDLFEGDLAASQIPSFTRLLSIMEQTEKQVISLSATVKQTLGTPISDVAGIKSTQEAFTMTQAMEKELTRLRNERITITAKLAIAERELNEENVKLRKELEQVTAAQKKNALTENEIIGVYQKSVNALAKMKAAYRDMAMAGNEATKDAINLKNNISLLDEKIKKVDYSVGNFQRNIGNYGHGIGKYTYSVYSLTQVMRELPNFAQSAQIGFMALSNNLPILAQEFQRVKEDVGSTGQAMKIFFKSIISWQTALLVLITLSVAFGKELGNWMEGLFSGKKRIDDFSESMKKMNEAGETARKGYLKEKVLVEQLAKIARDETKSKEERFNAIRKMNEISPEYLGNISMENVGTEQAIGLINNYVLAIERKARAQAMLEKLTAAEGILFDINDARADLSQRDRVRALVGDDMADRIESAASVFGSPTIGGKANPGYWERYKNLAAAALYQLEIRTRGKMAGYSEFIGDEVTDTKKGFGGDSGKYGSKSKGSKANESPDQIANDVEVTRNRLEQAENSAAKAKLERETYFAQIESETVNAEDRKDVAELLAKDLIRIEIALLEEKLRIMSLQQSIIPNQIQLTEEWAARIKLLKTQLGIDPIEKDKKEKNVKSNDPIKDLTSLYQQMDRYLQSHERLVGQRIDRQIDHSRRRQDELRILAKQGLKDASDNLALEEKKEKELERKQELLGKRQQRRQLMITGLQTYSTLVGKGDPNALGNTVNQLGQLVAAIQSLPMFYEGIEDTGTVSNPIDSKGGRLSILHNNERVLRASHNAMIGDMSNEELAQMAYLWRTGMTSIPMFVGKAEPKDSPIIKELQNVKKAIENKPVSENYWNDTERGMVEVIRQHDKVTKRIHSTGIWQR